MIGALAFIVHGQRFSPLGDRKGRDSEEDSEPNGRDLQDSFVALSFLPYGPLQPVLLLETSGLHPRSGMRP
jgi:hypothetical protein